MNTKHENILVDSCQYTPVYLVENTGAIQGRSFILTQANVEEPKPITDNLKRFYENSGILETSFVNNAPTFSKPRILKRTENKLVGNNLKLASFLLPKSSKEIKVSRKAIPVNNVQTTKIKNVQITPVNNIQTTPVNNIQTTPVNNVQTTPINNVQTTPVNNVVYKPVVTTTSVVHSVPKVEVERKIVRLKNFPAKLKPTPRERVVPKINKPKEEPSTPNPNPNPIKHTSVQLLKLGETYHSLNQLSDDQMKMVNQALKIFSNPENGSMEPTYDPVTNTRFIYKVVSPRDLTVVGKNKLKREELIKKEEIIKEAKKEPKKVKEEQHVEPELPLTVAEEVKVTRSGRKVKFPKQIVEEIPLKPKKKNGSTSSAAVVSCYQCSAEFCSLYRLQKHYENHPSHIPAKSHSNLFHCLLAIIKSGSEEDRTNIFIQQLEQLIEQLKSLLPCLLKKIDGVEGKPCTINDNIGRLFGMNPGKYNLNMDGLTCVKDKDGNCKHNPPPPKNNYSIDLNHLKTSPLCHTIPYEEYEDTINEIESEDCARINSVDKWPISNKRLRKNTQPKTPEITKRIKLASESGETFIELDDFVICNGNFIPVEQSIDNVGVKTEGIPLLDNFIDKESDTCIQQPIVVVEDTQNTTLSDLPKVLTVDKRPLTNRRVRNTKQPKMQDTRPKRIKIVPENSETAIELDSYVICNGNLTLPIEPSANNIQPEAISLIDNFIDKESENCINQQVVVLKDTQRSVTVPDLPKKAKGAHKQFHSAHFDIRSSPIKTSSAATFHKFQINPEKLAKYEVQIIRPLELDTKSEEVSPNSKGDINNSEVEVVQSSAEEVIPEVNAISNTENSVLQSIFRDDLIELTCKDPNDIPNDLAFAAAKEWISSGLDSVDGKSDEGFIKTNSLDESFISGNSLIEPALLHCKEDPHDKLVLDSEMTAADHLSGNDNHLLNQGSASVFNFLDSLGSECLSYPETEIRNNVDFQLDLFSFSNT